MALRVSGAALIGNENECLVLSIELGNLDTVRDS